MVLSYPGNDFCPKGKSWQWWAEALQQGVCLVWASMAGNSSQDSEHRDIWQAGSPQGSPPCKLSARLLPKACSASFQWLGSGGKQPLAHRWLKLTTQAFLEFSLQQTPEFPQIEVSDIIFKNDNINLPNTLNKVWIFKSIL